VTGTNNGDGIVLPGLVVGRTYKITADVASSTGSWRWLAEGTGTNYLTSIVTGTSYFAATSTGLAVYCISGGTITFNSVRVEDVSGTHAIQPTDPSRPVLRNRYNQLTYSEDLGNGVWLLLGSAGGSRSLNATTAPDGTITADKVIVGTGSGNWYIANYADPSVFSGQTHTFSVYLKAAELQYAFIRPHNNSANFGASGFIVNLSTGEISYPSSGTAPASTGTAISVGNGWWRVTAASTANLTVAPTVGGPAIWPVNSTSFNSSSGTGPANFTGNGTDGIFVWGADFRSANDTIYPYQRIEAATVYDSDTSKFPLYLACDGSDDSLYTAANLDLSSTDKVTVFAGVTKLSDAATAIFLELSADAGVNSGSFFVTAPPTAGQSSISFYGNGNGVSGTSLFNNAQVAAPVTAVIAAQADIPADSTTLRVDAVQVASSATNLGTGNFGAYPLYIGRRNNASLPFSGRIYQLIVRGAASSAAEISSTERYIAGKQGRSL
jgi:hypothetical protein